MSANEGDPPTEGGTDNTGLITRLALWVKGIEPDLFDKVAKADTPSEELYTEVLGHLLTTLRRRRVSSPDEQRAVARQVTDFIHENPDIDRPPPTPKKPGPDPRGIRELSPAQLQQRAKQVVPTKLREFLNEHEEHKRSLWGEGLDWKNDPLLKQLLKALRDELGLTLAKVEKLAREAVAPVTVQFEAEEKEAKAQARTAPGVPKKPTSPRKPRRPPSATRQVSPQEKEEQPPIDKAMEQKLDAAQARLREATHVDVPEPDEAKLARWLQRMRDIAPTKKELEEARQAEENALST